MAPRVPTLPRIPKMFIPRYPNSRSPMKAKLMEADKQTMAEFLRKLEKTGEVGLPERGHSLVRAHGCKMCPYWGSNRCFHELIPPRMHANHICLERFREVLEYVKMSKTYGGKEARRNEVIHKIANHIIALESNLGDYRIKKYEEMNIESFKDITTEDIKFDAYEQKIMGQIQMLSDKYAMYMREDMELEQKAKTSVKRIISPMDIGRALAAANKNVIEIEAEEVQELPDSVQRDSVVKQIEDKDE